VNPIPLFDLKGTKNKKNLFDTKSQFKHILVESRMEGQ